MPSDSERLTTGVDVLDGLIDDVRIGDNLVFLLSGGLTGEWLIHRFSRTAAKDRLIVVDGQRRAQGDATNVLRWSASGRRKTATPPEQAREELAAADQRVGPEATVVVESLTALARSWGDQAALDLFMWACPRLYRRRSVALWMVDRSAHKEDFVRRLSEITQVVVALQSDGDDMVEAEVLKADGRSAAVVGRRLRARLVDGDLVDARVEATARRRLGETIRELRTRREVGQAELARQVGISPSALSQAERGVAGLSAETLMRLWEILGVPWGGGETPGPGYRLHRRTATPAVALASGVTGRRVADAPTTVWHLTFAPRSAGRSPLFVVKAPETVTVVRGVLQVGLAGRTETLHEGDALVATSASIVSWTNPSDRQAEAVWIISDGRGA